MKDLLWRMGSPNPMWVGIMTSSVTSSTRTRLGVITVWGKRGLLSNIYRAAGGSEEPKRPYLQVDLYLRKLLIIQFSILRSKTYFNMKAVICSFIHDWLNYKISKTILPHLDLLRQILARFSNRGMQQGGPIFGELVVFNLAGYNIIPASP